MTARIIPRVTDPIWVGSGISRPWYAYLRSFGEFAALTDTQLAELTTRVVALEGGGSSVGAVQGVISVQSFGALPGIVQVSLVNDADAPGATTYYGTQINGEKGWYPVADTLAAGSGVTKAVDPTTGVTTLAHADTSSVANLSSDNANGVVLQDIAVTFDTFGHVQTITVGTTDLDLRYQPLDATLTALAGLPTAANKGIYATGVDAFATYDLSAGGRALGNASGAALTSPYFSALNTITNAPVTASGVNLWNIGGTSGSMAYLSAANAWSLVATTVGGRALLNNAGTINTTPWYSASNVVSLATTTASGRALWNIAGTANSMPYLSAADTWSLATLTAAGRALLDDANAAAQRMTLGLGNVDDTSDANKPVSTAQAAALALKAGLGSNTFTGIQTINGATSPAAYITNSPGGISLAVSANDALGEGFFGTLSAHDTSIFHTASRHTTADLTSLRPGFDTARDLGRQMFRWGRMYAVQVRIGAGDVLITSAAGSPEGVLVAPIGSLYTRTDGGAGTTLYVKESGVGATGWVAK